MGWDKNDMIDKTVFTNRPCTKDKTEFLFTINRVGLGAFVGPQNSQI